MRLAQQFIANGVHEWPCGVKGGPILDLRQEQVGRHGHHVIQRVRAVTLLLVRMVTIVSEGQDSGVSVT